ncbi:MAG TPA: deoxyribodipyrimidine photo-lyase [Dermatophilaceae bacterium]|nr:deoxyribodipyrimidine photo-lyase [Dermatophilaceae bacterium]
MPDTVLWLRRDLRLADLPALGAANEAAGAGAVLPLFVLDRRLWEGASPIRRVWLRNSLAALQARYDGALVVRAGPPEEVVPQVVREVGAASVHVTAETTPYGRRRDAAVRAALGTVDLVATGTPYAVGPGTIVTRAGTPYQVFTPFARAWRAHGWPQPAPVPRKLRFVRRVESEDLPPVDDPQVELPAVGEQAAQAAWRAFVADGLDDYASARDRPDLDATSRMSVHLKFGEIHPRTMLADIARAAHPRGNGATAYVTELAWREFYADVLWHRPDSAWADLREELRGMDYDEESEALTAWQRGRTGFPFVDAGMRQLVEQGWMHNRLRMVTASFLVKDLHVWWPHGARHFQRHLVDFDLASNNHGWQWTAGTGTDAAPYFRVFNPVSQGQRFDPTGDYVRRWVPELRHLAGAAVHEPWRAGDGYAHGYPPPIVDHAAEREEALRRYARARA